LTVPVAALEPESEARQAVEDELVAVVAVPHETVDAVYILDCYCFSTRPWEVLIPEMRWLQTLAPALVARYRAFAVAWEDPV
jgi:hypothetical protein